MDTTTLLNDIEKYYSDKIKAHGISAKGVDWNSEDSQNMRFLQLLKVINEKSNFSLLDYGCGYGAILGVLRENFYDVNYTGYDISNEMLEKGKELFGTNENLHWVNSLQSERSDFTIASGIFNVRLGHDQDSWLDYVKNTLVDMNERSVKGFAFNMLTTYSDKEYMKDYLYYADPSYFLDYCKTRFSKYISVLHDYPLYEFTILVRKYL